MKNKLSFILTLLSIIGIFVLAWYKNLDVQMLLPSVLGIYVLGRTTTNVSATWAASKDPNADTLKVVEMVDKKE